MLNKRCPSLCCQVFFYANYNSCSLHTSRLSLMTDYRAVHVFLSSLVPSYLKFKQELSSLCFSFANLEAWGVVLYSAQACFFLVRVLLEYTVEHVWRGFILHPSLYVSTLTSHRTYQFVLAAMLFHDSLM